ncbi:MAG TPA: hypothetical protein VF100_03380 [Thermoanaerobaculia bacterium]
MRTVESPNRRPSRRPHRGAAFAATAALALAAAFALAPAAAAQPESATAGLVADPGARLPGSLAAEAAASYREAARFPDWSRPVAPEAVDPVLAKRVPAPHSLPAPGGEATITVWPGEVSFEHPAPVVLHAAVDRPRGGGRLALAAVSGEVVDAAGAVVGRVTYADDGRGADALGGDGVWTATFVLPEDRAPALAESFGVRVTAATAEGESLGITGGFLVSRPHARLTGAYRDRLVDGDLVVSAEIEVTEAGRFHLAGTLAAVNGDPLAWAQAAAELEPGRHWLDLAFYGLALRERGVAGPYRLASLALATTTAMPNALSDLVEDAHRTRAWPLARFHARPFGNPELLRAATRLEADAARARRTAASAGETP